MGIIIVTYFLGKTLFNERVGLISAILLSVFPLFLFYTTQYGPDIPLTFFVSSSILFFIKGEQNPKIRKRFYFLSGLFMGFAYITKITFAVFFPLYLIYIIKKILEDKKFHRDYLFLLIGLLMVFILENVYYHTITDQWLLNLRSNFVTYNIPLNPNPDTYFYFKALFNMITIDDFYFFGFFSYIALPSILYLIKKREKNSFYVIVWLILIYIMMEFIIPLLTSIQAIEKDVRFLIILLPPFVIIISKFLDDIAKHSKILSLIIFSLLILTSIYYSWDSTSYVRTARGDIREAYNFLKDLPPRKIYTNIGYGDRLKFFFGFEESAINAYNCAVIDCSSDYYNSGKYIKDAYVILYPDADPLFRKGDYPQFVFDPPNNWRLLKIIDLEPPIKHNYLHIKEYNPEIYYAPPN